MVKKTTLEELKLLSSKIRLTTLEMIYRAKSSHIGSCFSIVDIVATLYGRVLHPQPYTTNSVCNDKLILSKGHAAACIYATLAEIGLIDKKTLEHYGKNDSNLMTHISHKVNHVEFSTGSLGHGLPYALGKAIANKKKSKIYAILSDGELNEGSNWEAIMLAGHLKQSNLIVIIDKNGLQSLTTTEMTLDLGDLEEKIKTFNWNTYTVDGHNIEALIKVLELPSNQKPTFIIAQTIKGKGVSFMENQVQWHYKSPSENEYHLAKKEISTQS